MGHKTAVKVSKVNIYFEVLKRVKTHKPQSKLIHILPQHKTLLVGSTMKLCIKNIDKKTINQVRASYFFEGWGWGDLLIFAYDFSAFYYLHVFLPSKRRPLDWR